MNNNVEKNQVGIREVNRTVQFGTQAAFSYTQMANDYIQKLVDAYNSALILERNWQKLSHSNDVFSEVRPDYFQESLKLFAIKASVLEQTRSSYFDYISGLDDDSLQELVNQVKKIVRARAELIKNHIPETKTGGVRQEILNMFSNPVLEQVYLELFGLYIQSLTDEEREVLTSFDTEKALLENVRRTRKTGDENFESTYQLTMKSIKMGGFTSTEISSICSTIEKASYIEKNELKKLDIVNELDSHHRLV